MITKDNVKDLFDYRDGKLIRKHGRYAGVVKGTKTQAGYLMLKSKDTLHYYHRVVWLWHNGDWPVRQIDHIDQDKTNNSIAYCVLAGPNGPDSNNDWAPWKAHSNDGSTGTFTASGDPENYTDFVIEFTITSADEITITLGGESKTLTVNSPTATHFSVWLNDDWSGSSNSNIYLKPTTQLVQNTLSIDKPNGSSRVLVSTTGDIYFGEKGHYELEVFNVQGKRVLNKSLDTQRRNQKLNFGLTKGLYLLKVKSEISTNSFVKKMLVK